MMVPDYALIGEIMFFAYGFAQAKECGAKMVTTFKLCSEQLSAQARPSSNRISPELCCRGLSASCGSAYVYEQLGGEKLSTDTAFFCQALPPSRHRRRYSVLRSTSGKGLAVDSCFLLFPLPSFFPKNMNEKASLRLRHASGEDGHHGGREFEAGRARRRRDGAPAASTAGETTRTCPFRRLTD